MISFVTGELLTALLAAQVGLIVWNMRVIRRPPPRRWSEDAPRISILVPVRDELANIETCIRSLVGQDYPNVEIIVLDDNSTDGTTEVLARMSHPRLSVVEGATLPAGWTGKSWACHQLSQLARGEVLCFVDADTILRPDAVSRTVGELAEHQLGLLSLLLRSDTQTFAAGLVLPMVNYAMLALLPAVLIERPASPRAAVALGPFILVTRAAYGAAGGHAADPAHLVDDVRLARGVKAAGHTVGLRNGTELVSTRWYSSFPEIWNGFSKNAYGALDHQPALALTTLAVAVPLLLLPFVRFGVQTLSGQIASLVVVQVVLILVTRVISARAGGDPLWSIPFHPLTITAWAGTLARSMLIARTGHEIEWKRRRYTARATASH
jgi:chlorobactene glucosyltransferase